MKILSSVYFALLKKVDQTRRRFIVCAWACNDDNNEPAAEAERTPKISKQTSETFVFSCILHDVSLWMNLPPAPCKPYDDALNFHLTLILLIE